MRVRLITSVLCKVFRFSSRGGKPGVFGQVRYLAAVIGRSSVERLEILVLPKWDFNMSHGENQMINKGLREFFKLLVKCNMSLYVKCLVWRHVDKLVWFSGLCVKLWKMFICSDHKVPGLIPDPGLFILTGWPNVDNVCCGLKCSLKWHALQLTHFLRSYILTPLMPLRIKLMSYEKQKSDNLRILRQI